MHAIAELLHSLEMHNLLLNKSKNKQGDKIPVNKYTVGCMLEKSD